MIAAVIKGITLGLLLSISVGPVIFAILKQSLNNGHRGGYAFIAGVSVSDIFLVVMVNLFSGLFDTALQHEKIIGVTGSAFLIGLGIFNIFFRKVQTATDGSIEIKTFRKRDLFGIFISGFFMNTLNPGALIFWVAASATIIADSITQPIPQDYRMIVFSTCLIFVLSADILKVTLANRIREKLTPHNIHIINRISGIILVCFGVAIIVGLFFYGNKIPVPVHANLLRIERV